MIQTPTTVVLNPTTFVPVLIGGTRSRVDVILYTDDLSPWEYSTSEDGTGAVPVPTGEMAVPRVNPGEILMYVRSAVSISFIVGYGRSK